GPRPSSPHRGIAAPPRDSAGKAQKAAPAGRHLGTSRCNTTPPPASSSPRKPGRQFAFPAHARRGAAITRRGRTA
ncbi:MAG: hypothetical protein LBB78_09575, partial [Spirochaetaceae bacterium]|nr:hypothetical protein [Spirochaetaceae bacterium]